MATFSDHDIKLAADALKQGFVTQQALQWCHQEMEKQFHQGLSPSLHLLLKQYNLIQPEALQYLLQKHPLPQNFDVTLAPDTVYVKAAPPNVRPTRQSTRFPEPSGPQTQTQTVSLSVVREIARGALGVVFEAKESLLGRSLAMKKSASSESASEFFEEAKVTAQLEHPNVIPIHKAGFAEDGAAYFTMKLTRGSTLAERIEQSRSEPPSREALFKQLDIFLKIGDGIAFAHSKKIIHRDLKPENIMLGDYGEVLITGWAVARVRGRANKRLISASSPEEVANSTINDGELAGTPQYMAPEQAACEIDRIGPRTDIYGLGALLYEILTTKAPIELSPDMSKMALLKRVMDNEIVRPSLRAPDRAIPRELEAIAMKALSEDPIHRYRDVKALQEDIRLYMSGYSVSALSDHWGELAKKLVGRNKLVSAIVFVGFLALTALVIVFYLNVKEQRRQAIGQRDQAESLKQKALQEGQRLRQILEIQKKAREARIGEDQSLEAELERARRLSQLEARVYSKGRGQSELLKDFDVLIEQCEDPSQRLNIMIRRCYAQIRVGRPEAVPASLKTLKEKGASDKTIDQLRIELHLARFKTLDGPNQKFIQEMAMRYPKSGMGLLFQALISNDRDIRLKYCYEALAINPRISYALAIRAGIQENVPLQSMINDCNRALEISPNMALAYGNRGVAYVKEGQLRRGVNDLKKSLSIHPNQAYAHRCLGRASARLGRVEEAFRCFDRALQLNPKDRHAHEGRIELAFSKGHREDWQRYAAKYRQELPRIAERYLSSRIESKGSASRLKAEGLNSKGYALASQGRFRQAIPLFEQALSLDPKNLPALLNLADALQRLERVKEVIPLCLKAIDLAPGDYRAYYQLSQSYLKFKDTRRAIDYCKKARSVCRDPHIAMNLGCELCRLFTLTNQLGQAKALTLELMRLYPNSGAPLSVLGQLQVAEGNHEGALKSYARAIQFKDFQSYYFRAELYVRLKRRDEANQDLLKALKHGPAYLKPQVKRLIRELKEDPQ